MIGITNIWIYVCLNVCMGPIIPRKHDHLKLDSKKWTLNIEIWEKEEK